MQLRGLVITATIGNVCVQDMTACISFFLISSVIIFDYDSIYFNSRKIVRKTPQNMERSRQLEIS